jgi:UDP-N-acetylmuramyl pentapeptide phosphotransferase/UDP-N-acetylglucosamine-1-phosphate transferase
VNLFDITVMVVLTGLAAWILTGLALRHLERRAILDRPNERSSHKNPTPRGGGIALVPVIVVAWGAIDILFHASFVHWVVIVAGIVLAAVSWIDDVRGLSPTPRFLSHIVAVVIVIALIPSGKLLFQGLLPPLLDRFAAALLWIWFINLFNFMDGIDGIAGVETTAIGLGIAIVAAVGGLAIGRVDLAPLGLALAATAAGFLFWNWHPARIFMGDVGSVPLGFFTGWLLIAAAADGAWAPALILPAYYLADATITLARRAARLEPVWQAHRQHYYQRAALAGWSHDRIALAVGALDIVLIGTALLAGHAPVAALAASGSVTAIVLLVFSRAKSADSLTT